MWPVIIRELRAGSRRWTTYWLRLLAAFAVMIGVLFWLGSGIASRRAGSEMFTLMHVIVLVAIWVFVPLMTCDCLSQEKREGTLGLLFLTNLSAREIVIAKTIAHGLRALTLWLAIIPIIGIPLLLGGLNWQEIVLSCSISFGSICFALSAAILASALSRRVNGAVTLVVVFLPFAYVVFSIFSYNCHFIFLTQAPFNMYSPGFNSIPSLDWIESSYGWIWNNADSKWADLIAVGRATPFIIKSVVFHGVSSLVVLLLANMMASGIARRTWQDKPKTKKQTEVENFFCKPVFWTGFFRRWMRRSLDHNPIGWLEKRSWSGRLTSWVWLAVMISFTSALSYGLGRDAFEGFNMLMFLLLGSIAYVAAGSFRRERETGALELILVTPLSERQIISGRLRGLWGQFLPTFILWVAVVLYLSTALHEWQAANLLRFIALYLVVPVVGLYFSLRSRFVLLSWIATLATCFLLPQLIVWIFYYGVLLLVSLADWNHEFRSMVPLQLIIMLPVQLGLGAFLLWRLKVNLVRRTFSFR